jgi:UDP-glucose:glycoprotein glucosyltransferase
VFCIATGASYEQLLRIMMLSAVKHTKHKLTFWLIDSLVSPQLRHSLDILSFKYSFNVQYVHYKWPSWLHRPNSRRLTAWASKVLFLDVLFPVDLKRVIFVDADQVIRDDLHKLYTIDLKEHVYGLTAFGNSRKEAEGYRFWKSGYWKEFLQGRPYFISALFVVDLERLRSTLTGDMLRGHYQLLSRDPNSLSNLDQDLLNHLQPQVPIFELPSDWLWCETWKDDGEKKNAKIIDLCSNPGRSESKLDSARRIIPEWQSLNEEVLKAIGDSNEEGEDEKEL